MDVLVQWGTRAVRLTGVWLASAACPRCPFAVDESSPIAEDARAAVEEAILLHLGRDHGDPVCIVDEQPKPRRALRIG